MTPFGWKMRALRRRHGVTMKQMAEALGVSSAYLSALEHGHRGRPSRRFVTEACLYFGIIWDDAEEMQRLAAMSNPRVTVDTAGLTPEATLLANELARRIAELSPEEIAACRKLLNGKA